MQRVPSEAWPGRFVYYSVCSIFSSMSYLQQHLFKHVQRRLLHVPTGVQHVPAVCSICAAHVQHRVQCMQLMQLMRRAVHAPGQYALCNSGSSEKCEM